MPDAIRLFDAHLHIIDPRFPLQENNGYTMCCGTTPPLCICGADRADRQAATGVTSSEADFASGLSTVLRKSFGSDSRMILAQAEATCLGSGPAV